MDEIEERDKEITWKLKAKASLILYHLFSGYSWSEHVFCTIQNETMNFDQAHFLEWDDKFSD